MEKEILGYAVNGYLKNNGNIMYIGKAFGGGGSFDRKLEDVNQAFADIIIQVLFNDKIKNLDDNVLDEVFTLLHSEKTAKQITEELFTRFCIAND